jgi:glutamate/tyrosine decarboxylase-like PLP-dependent enzyme
MEARDVRLDEPTQQALVDRRRELASLGSLTDPQLDASAQRALEQLTERLSNTYPYQDPRYIGQMLKPPHPVAWAAYATTMLLNPNNHALDGGPATAEMEREAVAQIAQMFGYRTHLGHLTSSGTIANLEALWVGRESRPGETILSGANAHYTHARMCALLGVEHETVPQDSRGAMSLERLEQRLRAGGVGTVVATLGTTGMGTVEPVAEILALCRQYGARLHVDAAYGGFFTIIADGLEPGVDPKPFAAVAGADSIVVDPHKHGLQPYGCGCVLFADPKVGRFYAHDSPYTYFTSDELHLGEISIECSRAGAAAAALWTTLQALPLTRDGLGAYVAGAREAALKVAAALETSEQVRLVVDPDIDIICPFPLRDRTSAITAASERAFDTMAAAGWHTAKFRVDSQWLAARHPEITADSDQVTTLRLCLMKPEQVAIADEIATVVASHLTA